jgi:hypothetical protein
MLRRPVAFFAGSRMTSSRREWSAVALVPVAALLVHELRYLFTYGPAAAGELAATGHSYLHELTPWLMLGLGFGVGGLLVRLARAWRTGEGGDGRPASFERLWLAATVALVATYAGQEFLEGLFATGHPSGLVGVFGDGGLWSLPAAALVGAGLAAWVRGAARIVAHVARLRVRRSAPARCLEVRHAPRPVVFALLSPLAASAAGRAPPRLS